MVLLALALSAALSGAPQAAPGASPPPPSGPQVAAPAPQATLEDVVVTGRQRDAIREFVTSLSASEQDDGQLGRFDRTVCPGVMGLRNAYAQAMNDQIARMAVALELGVGEPGCKPNILVIAGANARQLSTIIDAFPARLESDPRAGRHSGVALERLHEPRPVRWWHQVSYTQTAVASRLTAPERTEIVLSVILLDMAQIGSVNFEALADYVGMVALARLNADADVSGQDTILNLFEDETSRRAFTGLTAWDADYLHALYRAPRDAYRWQQESDTVWLMMRRRGSEADSDQP